MKRSLRGLETRLAGQGTIAEAVRLFVLRLGGYVASWIRKQLAILTGFEILRHIEAYVTIPTFTGSCSVAEDANAAIEKANEQGDQRSNELVTAFRQLSRKAAKQLDGVQGALSTYLEFF